MPTIAYLKDQHNLRGMRRRILVEAVMKAVWKYNLPRSWKIVLVSGLHYSRNEKRHQGPQHLTARAFDRSGWHRGAMHLFVDREASPTFRKASRGGKGRQSKWGRRKFSSLHDRLRYLNPPSPSHHKKRQQILAKLNLHEHLWPQVPIGLRRHILYETGGYNESSMTGERKASREANGHGQGENASGIWRIFSILYLAANSENFPQIHPSYVIADSRVTARGVLTPSPVHYTPDGPAMTVAPFTTLLGILTHPLTTHIHMIKVDKSPFGRQFEGHHFDSPPEDESQGFQKTSGLSAVI
ncbi:hypothetical protein BDN70DRAFT_897269 [Pholiota conissans]|uniref:Uncharacterized protein n=1 Tax=Pholiota conissans TaxID=109636 RepID=A0A9P5YXV2_9AGAR|nr:hypothetical protein BDN70DRAFT_897269 [Pholiota conissans]